jgi:hypothetical protein
MAVSVENMEIVQLLLSNGAIETVNISDKVILYLYIFVCFIIVVYVTEWRYTFIRGCQAREFRNGGTTTSKWRFCIYQYGEYGIYSVHIVCNNSN